MAKVNANNLYLEDLKLLTPKGLSKADSIAYIQAIIKKWAYNEIFYQQAVNYLTDEELDVTKELEEYKKDLLSYKFQKN